MRKRILTVGLSISLLFGSLPIYAKGINQEIEVAKIYKIEDSIKGLVGNFRPGNINDLNQDIKSLEAILKDKKSVNEIKGTIKLLKNLIIRMDEEEIDGFIDKVERLAKDKGLVDDKIIKIIKSEIKGLSKKEIKDNLNKMEKEINKILDKASIEDELDKLEDSLKDNNIDKEKLKESFDKLKSEVEKKNNTKIKEKNTKIDESNRIIKGKEEIIDVDFIDIKEKDWFYDYVRELVRIGSIKGYDDGTFRPQEKISFAEFLKVALTSATGKDYPMIQDVHWGMTYFQEAKELGVIGKGEFKYGSVEELDKLFNSPIAREDMAKILDRISSEILEEEEAGDLDESLISDYEEISNDRKESVKSVYKKGIIGGKDNGFDPKGYATRAETSAVIIRLIDKNSRLK